MTTHRTLAQIAAIIEHPGVAGTFADAVANTTRTERLRYYCERQRRLFGDAAVVELLTQSPADLSVDALRWMTCAEIATYRTARHIEGNYRPFGNDCDRATYVLWDNRLEQADKSLPTSTEGI